MNRIIDETFWKFILVGIINTAFGTAIMFGFYNLLHLNYWISSVSNYFFGSILSYYLNKRFTFKNSEKGIKPLIRFAINIGVCYTVAYGLAKPLAARLLSGYNQSIQENGAMFVGMVMFVGLNYLGQRFLPSPKGSKAKKVKLIQESKVIEFEVSGEHIQAVHMLPGYTHNIINLSDTENLVTLMWANEMFDPDGPDTFGNRCKGKDLKCYHFRRARKPTNVLK